MTIAEISTEGKVSSQEIAVPSTPFKRLNEDHFRRFFAEICPPDGCIEIRVPESKGEGWDGSGDIVKNEQARTVVGGWFNDADKAVMELCRIKGVSVYCTHNPVDADLLSSANNRFKKLDGEATKREHILCVRHLFIDIDPVRRSKQTKISATNEEKAEAKAVLNRILDEHPEIKAAALWGSSGNGFWILARIKELPTSEGPEYAKAALRYLASKFDTKAAKVDTSTFDPARLMCLPGTGKCKGDHTSKRPWRWATIDSPEGRELIPLDLEKWLANNPVLAPATQAAERALPSRTPAKAASAPRNGKGKTKGREADIARGRAYLAAMAPAISGQGGHNQTFDAACSLIEKIGLTADDAWPLLLEYNQRCEPPWDETDLRHKLDEAVKRVASRPPAGQQSGGATATQEGAAAAGSESTDHAGMTSAQLAARAKTDGAAKAELAARDVMAESALEPIRGQEDDPDRLARLFLEDYESEEIPTLRFWKAGISVFNGKHDEDIPSRDFVKSVSNCVAAEFERIHEFETDVYHWKTLESGDDGGKKLRPPRKWQADTRRVKNVIDRIDAITRITDKVAPNRPAWILTPEDRLEDFPDLGWTLPLANGILYVPPDGEGKPKLLPYTPKYFSGYSLDYFYDPTATCREFLEFLFASFPDPAEVPQIEFLLEYMAYCLFPDVRHDVAISLWGPTRSGKTTITNLLTEMIGAANVANPHLKSLVARFGLAQLHEKRIAIFGESHIPDSVDRSELGSVFKRMSGRERLEIEKKGKDSFSALLAVHPIFVSNERLNFGDDPAMRARIYEVQTRISFLGKEDPDLPAKLRAERSGILNLLITNLQQLINRGRFERPKLMSGADEDIDAMPPVPAFVDSECVVGPDHKVKADDFYSHFEIWMRINRPGSDIPKREMIGRILGRVDKIRVF